MKVIIFEKDKKFIKDFEVLLKTIERRKTNFFDILLVTSIAEKVEAEAIMPSINLKEPKIYFFNTTVNTKGDGIELAKKVRKLDPSCYIVFISKEDFSREVCKYFIRPSEYFLKPIGLSELEETLKNVSEEFKTFISKLNFLNESIITIRSGYKKISIYVDDIISIEHNKPKCIIKTNKGDVETYISMNDLETQIKDTKSGDSFIRCHVGYCVNLRKSTSIDYERNEINMQSGKIIPLARARKKEVRKLFDQVRQCY